MVTSEEVLTSKEVGSILRLSKNTVNELLRSGRIPSVRAGKKYLVSRRALEKWLAGEKSAERAEG
jgi:excisionase family DNA binding protein